MATWKNSETIECEIFRCPEGHTHVEFSDGGKIVFVMILDDGEVETLVNNLQRARNTSKDH